jgi:hypothetical protein
MAKKTTISKNSSQKVSFGKRRGGKHSKTLNKHASPSSKYRAQGR